MNLVVPFPTINQHPIREISVTTKIADVSLKLIALGCLVLFAGVVGAEKSDFQASMLPCLPNNAIVKGIQSKKLLQEFCKCPTAAELLSNTSALFKTISIDVGNYPTSSSQLGGLALVNTERLNPKRAADLLQYTIDEQKFDIFINQKEHLKIEKKETDGYSRLESLGFELNNGAQKNQLNELEILAYKGNISRDDYAIGVEKIEYATNQKTIDLLGKCQPIWKNTYTVPVSNNVEDYLFSQEMNGHTDFIRRKWIDCCQKKYCAKNPNDFESCNKNKNDFMDYYAFKRKPEEKREETMLERIAKNFHKASTKLQDEMLEKYPYLAQKVKQISKNKQVSNKKDDL